MSRRQGAFSRAARGDSSSAYRARGPFGFPEGKAPGASHVYLAEQSLPSGPSSTLLGSPLPSPASPLAATAQVPFKTLSPRCQELMPLCVVGGPSGQRRCSAAASRSAESDRSSPEVLL